MRGVKERNSSFELLRIISMIMITIHHLSLAVGIRDSNLYIRMWGQFFCIGGKLGVNCFVLISAYFLCTSSFRMERVLKTHSKVLLYGFIGLGIGIVFMRENLTIIAILKSFFPVIFNHYWFVTTYIGMILLSPILNMFLRCIDKQKHEIVIVILLFLFSIIPTFTAQNTFNSDLGWFVFLYIVAAYIKKYNFKWKSFLSRGYICPIIWILIYLASVVFTIGEHWIPALKEGTNFFSGMVVFPQFLNSLSLFLYFEKKETKSKIVDFFGRHSFGCYLIQSNCFIYMLRIQLTEYVFSKSLVYLYPIVMLLMSCSIFLFCAIADVPVQSFLDCSIVKKIQLKIERIANNSFYGLVNLCFK